MMPEGCRTTRYNSYNQSLPCLLDSIGAADVLARQAKILLKPNLVNTSPPPITLPVAAMEALVKYIRSCSDAELIIAEGTGMTEYTTHDIFRCHGYDRLAKHYDVQLIDLNEADNNRLRHPDCQVFPEIYLPKLAFDSFIVSFPVLKAHSLSDVTLTMKNMMGFPSHRYYQQGGAWRKSAFHRQMHRSIFELNLYRKPDLSIIDASIGMAEYHLGGPTCEPPVNKLVAGFDPVAVDAAGAKLLGFDWRRVEHIRLADGILGQAASAASGDSKTWNFAVQALVDSPDDAGYQENS
jgi:uncharacterized protein (DUF362 family)